MESIIITILFIATLIFLIFWQNNRDKNEEARFREFVIANKSKDVNEYVTALPSREPVKEIIRDELVDINDVPAEELLEAIKQEHQK